MNLEEPSQKDLTNIVKQIKEDKVKYILVKKMYLTKLPTQLEERLTQNN